MEISRFSNDVKYLASNGIVLNIDDRMNIGLALGQLASEIPFEELFFWGKIEGKYPYYLLLCQN
jgi:hypothetical protein